MVVGGCSSLFVYVRTWRGSLDSLLKLMTELLNAMKPIHDVVLLFSYQSDQDNDCISINSNDINTYLSWPSE